MLLTIRRRFEAKPKGKLCDVMGWASRRRGDPRAPARRRSLDFWILRAFRLRVAGGTVAVLVSSAAIVAGGDGTVVL